MKYIIAIDVGGTFTDCVIRDEDGALTIGKAFSTPPSFDKGIIDSIEVAASSLNLTTKGILANTTLLLHSCTVAENAVFDGTGAKAGLITTKGFEQSLWAMRGGYGRWFGLTEDELKHPVKTDKPASLIPLDRTRGVRERTDYKGAILVSADPEDVKEAVKAVVESGAEAIGVCFLWSFMNQTNELVAQKTIRELYPDLFFVISSEVSPTSGEYERTSTVALTAQLGPVLTAYLDSLGQTLESNGFQGSILIMQAYGGLLPIRELKAKVVGTIESGPAGGLKASEFIAGLLGDTDIIATDMGGTTFKVGVMRAGRFDYAKEPAVVRYHYSIPKMDIVSIGAGGGSIVSLEPRTKVPRVGPKSAGANPGPICYGFGGDEPTVTDVDLILGYLQEDRFLGGRKKLDREKALAIFRTKIAQPLSMDVLEAAARIYTLTNSVMFDLLHKITVERGMDPRNCALWAYGGQAALHAATYGQKLGVRKVVVPHTASVFGAFGLAVSDVVHDDLVSARIRVPARPEEVTGFFGSMEKKAVGQLLAEGFSRDNIRVERAVNMRYGRQVHTIVVPVEADVPLREGDLRQVSDLFEKLYEQRYGKGSGHRDAGMEIMGFRLRATAILPKPRVFEYPVGGSDPSSAYLGSKTIYLDQTGPVKASLYDDEKLFPSNEVKGPAIIVTPVTTILILQDQLATCDRFKNVTITW